MSIYSAFISLCQAIPSLSLYVNLLRHYLYFSIYNVIISLYVNLLCHYLSMSIYAVIISLFQSTPSLSLYLTIYSVNISLFQSTPSLSLYVNLLRLYLSMLLYSVSEKNVNKTEHEQHWYCLHIITFIFCKNRRCGSLRHSLYNTHIY